MMEKGNKNMNWELAARVYSGEASREECDDFETWLAIKENQDEWNGIRKSMHDVNYTLISENIDIEQAWQKVKPITVGKNGRTVTLFRTGIIAAAASVIVAVVMFLNPSDRIVSHGQFLTAQTNDVIEQLRLNDGSHIDLNRNSSIKYPSSFSTDLRALTLSGEAFFEVATDKKRPFVVNTQQIQIKVMGTAFNVKALPNSNLSEVCVREGTVAVSSLLNPDNSMVLTAGDKAIFNSGDKSWKKMQLSNNNYIAWKTKQIGFKNEELSEAIALIEAVYDVNLQVPDGFDLHDKKISTTFDKYTIEHIVTVLNGIYGVDFAYQEN